MNAEADLAQRVRDEIERLHAFIAGWFQGTIAKDHFDAQFTACLDPAFENIQPSGQVLTRADLLEPIRRAHGQNPDFQIQIRDVRVLGAWPAAHLALATYVEAQTGARNTTPPDNLRRSTVLFDTSAPQLIWRYLQETALPQ